MAGDRFRLQAKVINTRDGSVLWADSYTGELEVERLLEIQSDIAGQVATALGQPYGVIFQADLSRTIEEPGADWAAYSCTLQYYTYRVGLEGQSHPAVRKCLEDTVARFPAYATAWALLSQVYVDEVRFRFPPKAPSTRPSLERALEAAGRAIELDPRSVRAAQAKMLALWFSGDFASALGLGAEAFQHNANDTELMGEYGYRLVLSQRWREGCALVAKARDLSPGPPGYFETALALCDYREGRFGDALPWIRANPVPANPNYHLIAAAIYAEAGLPDEAAREVRWLVENAPGLVANIEAELAIRTADPELLRAFLISLAKAGVPASG
jgi:tetratricopeptide (TPR) repeat protein